MVLEDFSSILSQDDFSSMSVRVKMILFEPHYICEGSSGGEYHSKFVPFSISMTDYHPFKCWSN